MEAIIEHIDLGNPEVGYRAIVTRRGATLLFTDVNPATGQALKTYGDALRVLAMYAENGWSYP